jgi:hypothetical protein
MFRDGIPEDSEIRNDSKKCPKRGDVPREAPAEETERPSQTSVMIGEA